MNENIDTTQISKHLKQEALIMVVNCVRNTVIETYHAGIIPHSKTGDYTDVKVITPYGDIPWNELSRIDDNEMKAFNKQVADRLYTYLELLLNQEKYTPQQREKFFNFCRMMFPYNWDSPKLDTSFLGIPPEPEEDK